MRRQVVEIDCDRCDRVERRPVAVAGVDHASGPDSTGYAVNSSDGRVFAAVLVVEGQSKFELHFDELCTPCAATIRKHLEAIAKTIEKASPKRSTEKLLAPAPVVDFGGKKKAQG